ncbi:MAG TPA: hypothetical protein VJX93_05245 [Candidatus Methanomethylophilaceae archaeon]|nr:hypothetical protein [Candidatus Methanomethylophilaceae archaeon]
MVGDERLYGIIRDVSSRYGCSVKDASFKDFKDFKVSWNRKGSEKSYCVSDYLSDAPDDILYEFFGTLVPRAIGNKKEYSEKYLDWISSDEFVLSKRPTYLQRSRNVSRTTVGKNREIGESLDRLLDAGLIRDTDIHNSFYTWTINPNCRMLGGCNPMFRVITISSALDSDKVPEDVFDYVTYHETLHLRRGFRPDKRAHDKSFRLLERQFPKWQECEKFLSTRLKGIID